MINFIYNTYRKILAYFNIKDRYTKSELNEAIDLMALHDELEVEASISSEIGKQMTEDQAQIVLHFLKNREVRKFFRAKEKRRLATLRAERLAIYKKNQANLVSYFAGKGFQLTDVGADILKDAGLFISEGRRNGYAEPINK